MSEHGACFCFFFFILSDRLGYIGKIGGLTFFLSQRENNNILCANTSVCLWFMVITTMTDLRGHVLSWTLEVGTIFKDLLHVELNL